jgi:hypothetical protein
MNEAKEKPFVDVNSTFDELIGVLMAEPNHAGADRLPVQLKLFGPAEKGAKQSARNKR